MVAKTQIRAQEHRQTQKTIYRTVSPAEEEKIVELIVFNLGDEEFGADIEQVREIINAENIAAIPDSPEFIKGITNVRGEIAVVIDLKSRFFLPENDEMKCKHMVMTEQEDNLFGLMVDEVTEVLRIPEKLINSTPKIVTRIDRIYIRGVIIIENRLIIFLDLAKVLSEKELTKLAEFAKMHRMTEETKDKETKTNALKR